MDMLERTIEQQRKRMNLTQEEVAVQAEISRQYYNEIETNKKKPSVKLAKRLSEILGIEWTIFFA